MKHPPAWLRSEEGLPRPAPWSASTEGAPAPLFDAVRPHPLHDTLGTLDDDEPTQPGPEAPVDLRAAALEQARAAETARADERASRAFVDAAVKLEEAADAMWQRARKDAIELGLLVARELIGAELLTNPRAVQIAAQEALLSVAAARRVVVHVHADDLPALVESGAMRLEGTTVEIQADPRLSRGDVVVETEAGTVDARVETRFLELVRALRAQDAG